MSGKQPSILVIDHDQECRDILRVRLQSQDYTVAEADTGERALAILHAERFDFVLLDSNMSDVSSVELIRNIRANARIHETRIIVAGNRLDEKKLAQCLQHGADERLNKPYDIGAVKSLLWKYLAGSNKESSTSITAKIPEGAAVLVVDDNELNLELLSRRLRKAGFHVICASNGAQSLRLLNSANYDVVLLDIMMPELSGIDVLKLIRSNPKNQHVSVIMLSAMDDTTTIKECYQFGADDYMTKPYTPYTLTSCIESHLQTKKEREGDHFRK